MLSGQFAKTCAALILALLASVSLELAAIAQDLGKSSDRVVLFPLKKASIASEIDGVVASLPLKEGTRFAKDDILAELDSRLYKENANKALASVREAEATVAYSSKVFDQAAELVAKGSIGKQEYEKICLDRNTSEAKLAFAVAAANAAKINLSFCVIKAPYDGRLVKKHVSEWEYVKPGQPLLEIIQDSQLLAVVNISSSDALKLKPGDSAVFRIDETGAEVTGTFYESSGSVNPSSRTFEVKYLIDNADGKLLAGMSGAVVSRKSR